MRPFLNKYIESPSKPEKSPVTRLNLYIERRNGMIRVRQKVNMQSSDKRKMFRTLKTVKDTPKNYKDILRWADFLGHTVEERRPGDPL